MSKLASIMIAQLLNTPTISAAPAASFSLDGMKDVLGWVVGLLSTILGVWLAVRWRDKLSIRQVCSLDTRRYEELVALYLDRVPDYERVPPHHFKSFFSVEHSAKSRRVFRKRVNSNADPVHLMLIAETSRGVCGFLKAIFVPGIQCLFLAYFVADKGNTHEKRDVTRELLSSLLKTINGAIIRYIVYEICIDGSTDSHDKKDKYFRHYFQTYNIQVRQIMVPYKQPEVCAFGVGGTCGVTDTNLFIANIDGQPFEKTMAKKDFKLLVSSIYRHVYLMSYELTEPNLAGQYKSFLNGLSCALFKSLKGKEILLQ